MPEEVAALIGIAIVAVTFLALVKAILGYFASRRAPAADASVSQRELEALIEAAVERAIAPLHDRLDALDAPALTPRRDEPALLEDADVPVAARFRR